VESTPDQFRSSRPYRIALTIATVLLLLTLTAVIALSIVANAEQNRLEDEFKLTLTGVYANLHQTETAVALTTIIAPPGVLGEYSFRPSADSPVYSAGESCDAQTVTGQVVNQDSRPVDGFTVMVWGDNTPLQTTSTGEIAGLDSGRWSFALNGVIHRRVWVQLTAQNRYFSAPVEVIFAAGDCTRSRAEIVFEQVAPLE
jgi:hypothetical protein